MNVTEAIRSRRSIRKYKKGVVIPQEHFQLMLEAAMMAPSAGNTRPWEFLVVENRGILEKLTEINPYARMLRTASAAIVICAKPELQTGICSGFWPQDCGAAAENLILQAERSWLRHLLVRHVSDPAPGGESPSTAAGDQHSVCPYRRGGS